MEKTDKVLLGVAAGALVTLALRGHDVRANMQRMIGAADKLDQVFDGIARRAVGCVGNDQCACAICAEERK